MLSKYSSNSATTSFSALEHELPDQSCDGCGGNNDDDDANRVNLENFLLSSMSVSVSAVSASSLSSNLAMPSVVRLDDSDTVSIRSCGSESSDDNEDIGNNGNDDDDDETSPFISAHQHAELHEDPPRVFDCLSDEDFQRQVTSRLIDESQCLSASYVITSSFWIYLPIFIK
jgi:hypothetical protein